MSEETKHDKFLRIRDARMEKATKAISLLGNLASPNYEFSGEEAQEIISNLMNTVDDVRKEFGLPATAEPAPVMQAVEIDEDDDVPEEDDVVEVVVPARAVKSAPGEIIEIDMKTGREPKGLLGGWGFVGKAFEAIEDGDMETARDLLKTAMAR